MAQTLALCGAATSEQLDALHATQEWMPCVVHEDQLLTDTVAMLDLNTQELSTMFGVERWEPVITKLGDRLFKPVISWVDSMADPASTAGIKDFWARINKASTGDPNKQSCGVGWELHTHTLEALMDMGRNQIADELVIHECARNSVANRIRHQFHAEQKCAKRRSRIWFDERKQVNDITGQELWYPNDTY